MSGSLKYLDPDMDTWEYLDVPPHSHPVESWFPGALVMYAGTDTPAGWLVCNGGQYNVADFPELHAVIGYVYGGAGPVFNVPNMLNVAAVGAGSTFPLGDRGGSLTHGHTAPAMGAHGHGNNVPTNAVGHTHTVDPGPVTSGSGGAHTHTTGGPSGYQSVDNNTGLYTAANQGHTHTAGSGGAHTHSVDVAATTSSNTSHSHTVTPQANSAGVPSVDAATPVIPHVAVHFLVKT